MRRYRNIVIACLLLLFVGFAGYQTVYLFVLRPTITIAGSVSGVELYSGSSLERTSTKTSSFRVDPGSYVVQLTLTNGAVVNKLVSVGFRDAQTVSAPKDTEPVKNSDLLITSTGSEAIGSSNTLRYLDSSSGLFVSTDSSGRQQTLLPLGGRDSALGDNTNNISVNQVSPLPNGAELLLTTSHTPYYYSNSGQVLQLSLLGIDQSLLIQSEVLFGSNALNDDFVMSIGGTVYYYASTAANPQKIAVLDAQFNRLVYGGGKFLAFDTTLPYTSAGDLQGIYAQKYLVNPVIANIATKKSSELHDPLVSASLSPDGKSLVAIQRRQAEAVIYSLNGTQPTLNKAVTRPDNLAPVWLNTTSFAYSALGKIWKYDTGAEFSVALTKTDRIPSSISLQPNGGLLYTSLVNTTQGGIYRVSGQSGLSSNQIQYLKQFLYKSSNNLDYSWTYNDIERPTFLLTLTYPPGGSNLTEAQASQQFSKQLRSAKLDPALFSIKTTY